jgi:hypothetical protein
MSDYIFDKKSFFFREVRKIQPAEGCLYPGYPIFHYFTFTQSGFQRVDQLEYWKPNKDGLLYIYEEGDEFVKVPEIFFPTPVKNKPTRRTYKDRFEPFTQRYWGNKLFICTNETRAFQFVTNKYPLIQNPYSYFYVQVWIESPETYQDTFDDNGNLTSPIYWYDPFDNAFYAFPKEDSSVINNSENIIDRLFLPDNTEEIEDSEIRSVLSATREASIKELIAKGLSKQEAFALISSNAKIASIINENRFQQFTVTLRSPADILGPSVKTKSQPIDQIVAKMTQTAPAGYDSLTYEFIHKPSQISYSNIGSEWTSIERAANRPAVEWKSFKLMQVTFDFIVAPDSRGTLDDSEDQKAITKSVDTQLRKLRKMAMTPAPVTLTGFDEILTNALDIPIRGGSGISFAIADFSINSALRTSTGAINRAVCSITLQELPIEEALSIISFPKLKPEGKPPKPKNENETLSPECRAFLSEGLKELDYDIKVYQALRAIRCSKPPIAAPGTAGFGPQGLLPTRAAAGAIPTTG